MLGRKMPLFGTATADLWILLFYTSVFFRVTAAVAADFNLQPRKNVDHNLDCRRSPLPSAESWPPLGAPRSSFQNLTQLCGRVADRRTVGCLCDKPYTGVKCPNTGAISVVTDQALWRSYQSYCEGYCRCATLPNRDWSIFDEGIIRDAADASAARQRMYDTHSPPAAISGIPSRVTTRSLDALRRAYAEAVARLSHNSAHPGPQVSASARLSQLVVSAVRLSRSPARVPRYILSLNQLTE